MHFNVQKDKIFPVHFGKKSDFNVGLIDQVFLVSAFLGKSARLLQWLVFFFFFVRLQSHSDWATFLTIETTKTTTIRPSPVSGI